MTDLSFLVGSAGTLADHAIAYAELGWPVHPLLPGSKVPATRNGLKDATTDRDRIARYWQNNPAANIGLATGHAFDVLDVDVKDGQPGMRSMAALNGAGLLAGCIAVACTPSGGYHLLYPPSGDGNHAGRGLGLDYRGRGGYIVAAPSRLEGIAEPYSWADVDIPGDPAPCDWERLVRFLRPPDTRPVPYASGSRPSSGSVDGLVAWVAGLQKGNRNEGLYWAARRVRELDGDPQVLLPAALQCGLDRGEAERTIASAGRA